MRWERHLRKVPCDRIRELFPAIEAQEAHLLHEEEIEAGIRLACMCRISGDFMVSIEKASDANRNGLPRRPV